MKLGERVSSTRHEMLDQLESELSTVRAGALSFSGSKHPSSRRRIAAGAAVAGVALSGMMSFNASAPASAADSCQPAFSNTTQQMICYGYAFVEFKYKSTSWYGGTQCYNFDRYQFACSWTNKYYVGAQSVCKTYY